FEFGSIIDRGVYGGQHRGTGVGCDRVNPIAVFLERLERTNMRETPGAATAERQADGSDSGRCHVTTGYAGSGNLCRLGWITKKRAIWARSIHAIYTRMRYS